MHAKLIYDMVGTFSAIYHGNITSPLEIFKIMKLFDFVGGEYAPLCKFCSIRNLNLQGSESDTAMVHENNVTAKTGDFVELYSSAW